MQTSWEVSIFLLLADVAIMTATSASWADSEGGVLDKAMILFGVSCSIAVPNIDVNALRQ